MNVIRIILLASILMLVGCATSDLTPYVYSLKIQRIYDAYLDDDDNLLVCLDGKFSKSVDVKSPMTIILPLSSAGLAQLVERAFYYPNSNYKFSENEIRGYKFVPNLLRQGCLSENEKKNLRPISVDTILVHKSQAYSFSRSDEEKIKMGREATTWLEQMKPGDSGGRLYQICCPDQGSYSTLIYVADTSRFNGTYKAEFSLFWDEYGPVRINPLIVIGNVIFRGPFIPLMH